MDQAVTGNRPVTYRDVFRNGNWIRLWTGQTISQLGDAISDVALPLQVYALTKSAVGLGFGFAIELLPIIVIGPLAGILADRLNRRTLLLIVDFVRILCAVGMFFSVSAWQLYLLALIAAIMQATFLPTYSAVIPQITDKQYVKSISLSYTGYRTMQVIGPMVAAGLIGLVGGPRPMFLLDAATFAFAFCMTLTIHVANVAPKGEQRRFWGDLQVGWNFLGRSTVTRYIASYNVMLAIATTAATLGTVLYIKGALGLSNTASNQLYGLTGAVLAGTVALATWLIGLLDHQLPKRPLILWGPVVSGIAYLAFFFRPGPVEMLLLFFIISLGNACALVPVLAYLAAAVPNEVRGRVYAFINAMSSLANLLAYNAFGALGLLLPPMMLLVISGVLLALGIPLCTLLLRGARALREHDEAKAREHASAEASASA